MHPADVLLLLPAYPGSPIEVLDVGELTAVAEVLLPPTVSIVTWAEAIGSLKQNSF